MISFEEAYDIVISSSYYPGSEKVDIKNSLNRVLAEDIISDMDMPPFDKSAMDGYACRQMDLQNELEMIEIIKAGEVPKKVITKNKCAKIMTGAIVPKGADCVIMVEYSRITKDNKIQFIKKTTNINICYKGEDIKKGQIVLKKGTILEPQHIAILASSGYSTPLVSKQPKIAIISTGNELVEPENKPGISQIRNSNAYQLIAQVKRTGLTANYSGIVDDSEDSTYNAISKSLKNNDITILTGGVSMGDYDHVPQILKKLKLQIFFDKLAIKPGKPTVFGRKENKFCFGLPGNPVSSFILFELLVKPFILKLMGANYDPPDISLPFGKEYHRKVSDRLLWIPVKITENNTVEPVEYHGSAHIHSLSQAKGIIPLPAGKKSISKGEIVHVRQL